MNPDGTVAGSPVTVNLPGRRTPSRAAGMAFAPDGSLLVTLDGNNTLGVVDTTTNTLVKQMPV